MFSAVFSAVVCSVLWCVQCCGVFSAVVCSVLWCVQCCGVFSAVVCSVLWCVQCCGVFSAVFSAVCSVLCTSTVAKSAGVLREHVFTCRCITNLHLQSGFVEETVSSFSSLHAV